MKKLLVVSAIALGLTGVANAGGLPEAMPMAPMAYSSDTGVYLGIQGGWGLTNWKNVDTQIVTDKFEVGKDNGFVGRVFLGYDICKHFAVEAGYTYFFNKPEFNRTVSGVKTENKVNRTHAIDLMGKIKAPLTDEFSLYAKLGAVYLMTKMDKDKNDSGVINVAGIKGDKSRDNINVAFGAGADYNITPNVIANVEWLRFNGRPAFTDDKYQPYTDAFMIGLRYKFDM